MSFEPGQILYRASIHRGAGRLYGSMREMRSQSEFDERIWFEEYIVVKPTPAGGWVTWRRTNDVADHDDLPRRWVRVNGRFASATKQEAVRRLRARTRAYLRIARARMEDAEERARILGLFEPAARTLGLFDL